ncbi:MAG: decaprenyl-phosphate phosphoribosyltransferase [Actinobacteria bacterium]|jgi:decaprenyl-phosphate phosphoribosyltransferase|nr:decaprenyl-phosphate phosphoribosyltransferase [Actinomycetota bacterium]NBR66399.1 decaprenyl-phosphate phosphoribosyltransferase [Actinomycetota bacterium]NBU16681.1 decaprenyl-phosphate phosphoribosyltransferase [Actinomycetota bacterium]
MIGAVVREARPKQWLKNVLVFAAPAALGDLSTDLVARSLIVFVAFCMTASGTYYWNDIKDVEADRAHPAKRNRPIASGAVPLGVARVIGTLLLLGGPLLAFAVRPEAGGVVGLYAVLTVGYSVSWKHIALLDLALVASGFVLRAMAGAAGTDTHMSSWFVMCTSFGSFFIVAGKRFAELLEMGDNATVTRRSLSAYSVPYLRQLLSVSCTATVVSYCLWAFENGESASGALPWHGLSIVPMVLALLRYMMVLEQGGGGAPEEVFTKDRSLQLYGLAWVAVYALGVYGA